MKIFFGPLNFELTRFYCIMSLHYILQTCGWHMEPHNSVLFLFAAVHKKVM
jgi:hypothetical protein